MKNFSLPKVVFTSILLALSSLSLNAQHRIYNKDVNKDPMVMRPGFVLPVYDQPTSSVITIGDYDNFKLGVDFAECSVANNPMNPLQFYAVWNAAGGTVGGKGYYTNDGFTWTAGNPTWSGTMWGDVVVSYDSLGNLAYQNMYGTSSNVQGVKVAMSSDNGQTWATPLTAMSGSDKNWIFSDQTSGPYSNYIYGTMTNNSGSGQSFSRSTNLGLNWQSPTSFNPGGAIPGTSVCVGPNGDVQGGSVYVVTNSGNSFAATYTFYKSTNGGQSFTKMSNQQFSNTVGTQVNGRNAVLNMRTRPYPNIACDNSYGPHRGRLYLVYASNNPSGNNHKPDIFCRYSDNGGSTWSTSKVINDDPNSQNNHNWFPAVWCEKNTGRLYVSWMDTRDCPTSDSCMIYASYSDDGVSFVPNQRISNKKMKINCNSCGGGDTPMYLGDYNGVAANRISSLMAWTDFRDGNFGSYVAYFPDFGLRAEPAIDTLNDVSIVYAKVPSVKAFTDTVVVSATISGIAGLFTISYPQGNKLWSFPGEVPIQISPNSSVPPGDYTLSIVATGSNGTPVHKRSAVVRSLTPVIPVANFSVNDPSACEGQALNFTDASVGPPTSWNWSFPGGTPSTSNVQYPSGIVYNTAGSYDVTLTVTNQAGTNTVTKTGFITVNPTPLPPVANSVAVCEGQSVPLLTATGSGIKWYKGSVLAGSGNTLNTFQTEPGIYNYSVSQTVNGCQSSRTEVSLTIHAIPEVSFLLADSICAGVAPFDLTGGTPSGGLYSGPGVAENGLTFSPALAGVGNHIIKYVYSDSNSCADSAFQTITVKPSPSVVLDPVLPVCQSNPAITLHATPSGGTFSGTGVTGNTFNPATSGPGEFMISYSYTDMTTNCVISANQLIKVNPLPSITLKDTSLCGNRVLVVDGTTANAVSYVWNPGNVGTATIHLDTIGKGLGQFTYSLTVTDVNTCVATKSMKVTFFNCTGIENPLNSKEFELYPNPNSGQFSIRSNSITSGIYRIRIFNESSTVVFAEDNVKVDVGFTKPLNLKHLANGSYLMRIENQSSGWSKQFVINR